MAASGAPGSPQSPHPDDPQPQGDAYAVVDAAGRLLHWSPGAERLLGYPAAEVLGTPVSGLLGDRTTTIRFDLAHPGYLGTAPLRHRDGGTVEADLWVTPLSAADTGTSWLLQADRSDAVRQTQLDRALLNGLFTESPVAIGVFDADRRFLALNRTGRRAGGFAEVEGRTLREVAPPGLLDLDAFEERQRTVLDTGEPLVRVRVEGTAPAPSHRHLVWTETVLPLRGGSGEPIGLAHILVDNSRQELARERLRLVNEAGLRIGGRLDVRHTAQRLADFVVPELCDYAHVDLFDHAFGTGESDADALTLGRPLLRAATATAADWWPERTVPAVGEVDPFASSPGGPVLQALADRQPVLLTSAGLASAAAASDNPRAAAVAREHVHSWLAVPMYVRGMPFGVAVFVRFKPSSKLSGRMVVQEPAIEPARRPPRAPRRFDPDEVVTAEEIVQRAGIAVDHARRYVRERARGLDLQRRLLPSRLPNVDTVEVAYRYLPARGPSGLGGAWYDFIRLSGARTALVMGDAAGEGAHAAVYMARFRTATRILADLDLSAEEVLSRLDGHAKRVMVDFALTGNGPIGTTVLFATFDPIKQELSLASAGHPPPVVHTAAHGARAIDMPIGHPLGTPGAPYEQVTMPWAEGDVLILNTKGLSTDASTTQGPGADALTVQGPGADAATTQGPRTDHPDAPDSDGRPGALLDALRALTSPAEPDSTARTDLSELCDRLIERLGPSDRICDAALMAVRPRCLDAEQFATWELETDPKEVARARTLVNEQLNTWGLAFDFDTELMVSELVTNALRYGKPPIQLRVIRDKNLTCEVLDHSSTSPHLRHAADTDEGGRGLYLIAQLADRWGTRYHDRGKTIWVRQPLPHTA